jgi:hypothetical protein
VQDTCEENQPSLKKMKQPFSSILKMFYKLATHNAFVRVAYTFGGRK